MKIFVLFALCFSFLRAQDTSTIEGTVVDSVTGTGLPDVAVYFGTAQGAHYDAITDSAGKFRITGLKNGQ